MFLPDGDHAMPHRLASYVVYVAAGCLATAWVRAEVPAAANWISNPSFEEGEDGDPVDWVFFRQHEKTTGTSDASAARTGVRGATVKGEGGQSFGRWITPYRIALEPGTKYRVSFWYRGTNADVYLIGQAAQVASSGSFTVNLNKPFKISMGTLAQTNAWTFVEKEITSPGNPAWAQLCLAGSARETCAFDDIALERPGLTLLAPRIAQVVPPGSVVYLNLYAPELRASAAGSVTWKTGVGTEWRSARKIEIDGTWEVGVAVQSDAALDIEAVAGTGKTLKLAIPKFFRVTPSGSENLFTFAAITDAHFYRPGANERNAAFAPVVAALNALDPLFVVSLGDQMEKSNGRRDEHKKWICEAVREQLGGLAMPVFTIAGNHETDRTYEGAGTRWYHEKYLGQPRNWSFRVGKTLFAGLDVSTPGVAARERGASFLDAGQDAWLDALLSAPRDAPPVIAAHISPFNEWPSGADRDRFLSLLLGKKVGVLLTGHTHYTEDVSVTNGQTAPPWPQTEILATAAQAQAALDSPDKTTILTTTACSPSADVAGTTGYRYLLVKNGRIAWQSVLPASLSVQRTAPSPGTVSFAITNGADKPLSGLPVLASVASAGHVAATVDGAPVTCTVQSAGSSGLIALVEVDVSAKSSRQVVFVFQP